VLDDRGKELPFLEGTEIFLFFIASIPALGPIQAPIQSVPEAVSGSKGGQDLTLTYAAFSDEFKNAWSCTSTFIPHDLV
jgi:hypothetical protein